MTYRLDDENMFMDISDGIAVVINSETGIYYGMNEFGSSVFNALTEGMDTDIIAGALKGIAGVPSDMEGRLEAFIRKLCDFDILLPGSGSAEVDIDIDAAAAAANDFELEVTAFDDAQEMLLADPIHEVKEETGWTPEKDSIGYTKEETKKRERKIR